MFITITERASVEIEKRMDINQETLRLLYDTEGCGCAVSGVPTLYKEKNNQLKDVEAQTNTDIKVYFNPQHEVFFGDLLIIDFSEKANTFQLKTPNEMLSPRMRLI